MPSTIQPRIIFLTGAGLSADSGVKTFRGADGLHAGLRAEELLSEQSLRLHPEPVHIFCDDLRTSLAHVKPNAAHKMIAGLRKLLGDRVIHFTQNVDDLCERAGDTEVIHLHGELCKMTCANGEVVDIGYKRYWSGDQHELHERGAQFRSSDTDEPYRPGVVLFGEAAPNYQALIETFMSVTEKDLIIIIGTQGNVLPVNELCMMASEARKVLVNLHVSEFIVHEFFDHVIIDRAAHSVSRLNDIIEQHFGA
jgi:NAD-dependent deacetylase